MATPSTVTAVYTDALVSTFDIHKPEKRNKLFLKYGKQGADFFNTILTLGYKSGVAQTDYSHFTDDWIHQAAHVNANVVDPGAGNPISFVLNNALDVDANGNFYIAVNDNVLFANQVPGIVTVITDVAAVRTVTVRPMETTDNIGALSAGDTVIIHSDSWAEGTTQPAGKVTKPIEYFFNTKIVKQSVDVTGTEMTNMTWVETDSMGNKVNAWYLKGIMDADYEMQLRIDGAMLFDKPTTDATLVTAGQRTMFGLVPWVRSGGNADTYLPGFYAMADFDIMNNTLDQNFAPSELLGLLGIQYQAELENLFVNSFNQGGIRYVSFEGKEEQELFLGFKSITKNGRTWILKRMGGFNNPQTYGAPGYTIPGMGVFCPLDKQADKNPNNKGNYIPSIGLRYKELNSYNRMMEVWTTGGAGNGPKTSQVDVRNVNHRAECGSEFIANNRFFLVEPS
jgi:hypothetical protein